MRCTLCLDKLGVDPISWVLWIYFFPIWGDILVEISHNYIILTRNKACHNRVSCSIPNCFLRHLSMTDKSACFSRSSILSPTTFLEYAIFFRVANMWLLFEDGSCDQIVWELWCPHQRRSSCLMWNFQTINNFWHIWHLTMSVEMLSSLVLTCERRTTKICANFKWSRVDLWYDVPR